MKSVFSKIFLIAVAFSVCPTAKASVKNLRINEVLVKNETNYVDPYGVRSGWFEVFNTGYSMADIGGCYVTNDMNNPKKYRIPKGNPKTRISSRAYALFYAYDKGDRGIFHINFSLDEKGFLAIFDQSGRLLIDSVSYDINAQTTDHSFGKMENEPIATAIWHSNLDPTPEAINYTTVEKTRADIYKENDPFGGIITITTMTAVFSMLTILAIIFTYTGRYFKRKASEEKSMREIKLFAKTGRYIRERMWQDKVKEELKKIEKEQEVIPPFDADELDVVAIATALYLHFSNQHEIEQTGFYLNRPLNHQTAWTAKNNLFKKSPIRK